MPMRDIKILLFFVGGLLFLVVVGVFRTLILERTHEQELFVKGTMPESALDGFYKGTPPPFYTGSWRGKVFNATNATGVNLFEDTTNQERYPFRTFVDKGLRDRNQNVFVLDYNIESNPFWLRWVRDEIVEIDRGNYLGKVHVRLIPGLPFTFAYFRLQSQGRSNPPSVN